MALVLVVLPWSGWWLLAGASLRSGLDDWLAERRDAGWQAEAGEIATRGYPLTLETTLRDVALADPGTGAAVAMSSLVISSPTWWPGHVTVRFPQDTIGLASPQGRASLMADQGTAVLRLHPGSDLELQEMSLTSGPWGLTEPAGDVVSAMDLTVAMAQDETAPQTYGFAVNATDLKPGRLPREALFIPEDWPLTFEAFSLDMTVAFDRVWDRTAIEQSRPQPRRVDLTLAEAAWGPMQMRAAAELDIDAKGIPEGTVTLQARNWREMLSVAQRAGVLSENWRPQVERLLAALAGSDGNPDAFDVTLTFRNGLVSLGFLPIGPAPRIVLR
jgi:hypothetical protein